MKQPVALVQLVSEQTMQNVLPALAMPASRMVLLYTDRVADRMQSLECALLTAGATCEFVCHRVPDLVSVREMTALVRREVAALRSEGLDPVVNFTGGTKIMSAGAYAAAILEKSMSIYVDTEHERFVDGESAPGLPEVLPPEGFGAVAPRITVDIVTQANGVALGGAGRDWQPLIPLAELVCIHERACWEAFYGRQGLFPDGYLRGASRNAGVSVDLPHEVSDAAIAAGLLESGDAGAALPKNTDGIERAATFFTGGWWEVIVASAMDKSGRYRDIRWSVTGRAGTTMEEDILAVDGVQLLYVSCKRGGAGGKLSRLLEEIDSSARRLGGIFVRKTLAVFLAPDRRHAEALHKRARQLNIQIVTGRDMDAPKGAA